MCTIGSAFIAPCRASCKSVHVVLWTIRSARIAQCGASCKSVHAVVQKTRSAHPVDDSVLGDSAVTKGLQFGGGRPGGRSITARPSPLDASKGRSIAITHEAYGTGNGGYSNQAVFLRELELLEGSRCPQRRGRFGVHAPCRASCDSVHMSPLPHTHDLKE